MKGKGEAVNVDLLVIPPPNTFLNVDCMELMKKCPNGYFDLAIVDPPYGIAKDSHGGGKARTYYATKDNSKMKKWDIKPAAEYFDLLKRVSKNQIIWGGNYFTDNLYESKGWIFWDKQIGDNFFSDGELAWTSFNRALKMVSMRFETLGRVHPNQKPIKLYKWILERYAKAGDKILDTHVGSGSSLIACIELGYDYYGTEIDKDYYEKAKKRISRAFRKPELFD